MPNWCNNSLEISHSDPAMMKRVEKAFKKGGLFQAFVPMPLALVNTEKPCEPDDNLISQYGASNWWDWRLDNWGCKWDTSEDSFFSLSDDGLSGSASFETAWCPPIKFYQKLREMGFTIFAVYIEDGMGFAGSFDGETENYIDDYNELFSDKNWRDDLPELLVDLLEYQFTSYCETNAELI
jgi:hypothetical protein